MIAAESGEKAIAFCKAHNLVLSSLRSDNAELRRKLEETQQAGLYNETLARCWNNSVDAFYATGGKPRIGESLCDAVVRQIQQPRAWVPVAERKPTEADADDECNVRQKA